MGKNTAIPMSFARVASNTPTLKAAVFKLVNADKVTYATHCKKLIKQKQLKINQRQG